MRWTRRGGETALGGVVDVGDTTNLIHHLRNTFFYPSSALPRTHAPTRRLTRARTPSVQCFVRLRFKNNTRIRQRNVSGKSIVLCQREIKLLLVYLRILSKA